MISRYVFEKCGSFDERFEGMRMGDGEFGLRAYIKGFKSISNPLAKRDHLKIAMGGLREMGSWDGVRSTSWFKPKPIPSILYFFRKYWGDKNSIFYLCKVIPISLAPYYLKGKKHGTFISLIYFLLFFPIIFLQIYSSWEISKKMIKKGSKIHEV
jgi:GT2 family glycosyltransferase